MTCINLNSNQIEWLSNNMPHFGEMFLTAREVRRDTDLYKHGYYHHRNRIFATERCTPVQSNTPRLPLFERIATLK